VTARRGSERRAELIRRQAASRKRSARVRWLVGLGAAAAVGVVAWAALGPGAEPAAGRKALPGPLGGPTVAQDVNTLIGRPGPAFALPDSDGNSHSVTPGQGRPLLLLFHMGIR